MRKIRPGKHAVHSEVCVTALPVSGHTGAMVCPWQFADRATLSSRVLTHSVLFSPASLFSFTSSLHWAFFPWCWPSPFRPFSPPVWLQIYGRFLPEPARDCWASIMLVPRQDTLAFSSVVKIQHCLPQGPAAALFIIALTIFCLLWYKVSEAEMKTIPDPLGAAIDRC